MSRTQYVRNTTEQSVQFPTLDPPLSIGPGEVAGLPADVPLPAGVELARAADHKGEGKPAVSNHPPVDEAQPEPDRWHGEPAEVLDPTAPEPADAPADAPTPAPEPTPTA